MDKETAFKKILHYCNYQERCKKEIYDKLKSFELEDADKFFIINFLQEEGFINDFTVTGDVKKELTLSLKYAESGERVISGLKKISKPGLRINAPADKLPRVLNGLGIAIISTSQGVMTDRKARKLGIGGEVIAYVW